VFQLPPDSHCASRSQTLPLATEPDDREELLVLEFELRWTELDRWECCTEEYPVEYERWLTCPLPEGMVRR
jgi:hypothetical protein